MKRQRKTNSPPTKITGWGGKMSSLAGKTIIALIVSAMLFAQSANAQTPMDFIDIDGSAATDVELANDALSSAGVFGTKNLFAGFVLSDDGVSFWDGAWTDDDSPTPAFGNGYLFDLLTSIEILGVNAGGEGAAAVATNDAQGFFRLVDIYIAGKTASDELAGFVYRNNGDFVGEISGRNVSVFADNGTSAYGVYFRDTLRSGGVAADWWADITDSVVFNDIIAIGENEAVGFLAATIQDGASVTLNSVTASSRGEADDVDASWAMGVQLDGIANGGTLTVTDLIDVTGTDAATYGLFVRDTFDGDGVVGGIMAKSVDGIAEGVRVGRGLGVPVNLDGTLDVGIIAVNAVGEAYGIHVIGEVGGKIDVSSTITAISANDSAYGIRIHDGVMAGAEIDVLGKITATGGGAGGAAGFAVHDGTTAGTINLNAVETSGTWAVGVHSLGELEGDLTINGLLKATATEWDAIGLMVGHLSTFEDITGSVTVDEIAVSATAVGSIAAGDLGANAFGIRAGNIDDLTLKGNITVDGTGGETSGIQALGYANITLDGNVTMRATWTGDEDWDGGNAKWVGAAIWTDGNLTVNLNTKMLDVVGGVKADGGNVTFNGAGTANLDKVTAGNNFANNGNIVNVSGNMDVVGTLTNSGTLKVDGTLTYGTLNNTGGLLIETTKGPNGTWTYGGGANMPDPLSGAVNAGVFDSYGDTIGVFVNGATGTFNVKGDTIITTAFADYGSTNVDAGKTLSFTFAGTALINELGGAGNVAGGIGTDITVMGTDSLGFTGNIQTNGTGNMDIHNGAYSGILDAANDLNIVTGVFNGTMRAGNDVNIAGDAGVFNGDVVAGNSVNIQNGQYNGNITAQGNSVNIAAGEFGGAVFGAMDVNVAGGAFNANGAIAAGNNVNIQNGQFDGIIQALGNDVNIAAGEFGAAIVAANDVNVAGGAFNAGAVIVGDNNVNIYNGQFDGTITARGNDVNIVTGEFGGAIFGAMDVNVAGGAFNANGAIAAGNNVNIQNGQFDGIIQALGNDVNIAAGEFGAAIVAANDVNVAGGAFNAGAVIVGDNNVNIYNGQFDGTITARGNNVNIVTGEFGGAIDGANDVTIMGGAFNAGATVAAGNDVNIHNGQFDGTITSRGNNVNIVTGEFGGAIDGANNVTIMGGAFNAGATVAAGNDILIDKGTFEGAVTAGRDIRVLNSTESFHGPVSAGRDLRVINGTFHDTVFAGRDIRVAGNASFFGATVTSGENFILNGNLLDNGRGATVEIGANTTVTVGENWVSIGDDNTLAIGYDFDEEDNVYTADFGLVNIDGDVLGVTNVQIDGLDDATGVRAFFNVHGTGPVALITALDLDEGGADSFVMEPQRAGRYRFGLEFDDVNTWNLGLESAGLTLPGPSALVMMNIVGFELPRPQYTNGPWVRFKGGEINDKKVAFKDTTYQSLQVGWEATINANGNGFWNAGAFFDAGWMYGKGTYDAFGDRDVTGRLKSSTTGTGGGFYLSREFRNKVYVDFVGRINSYTTKVDNFATDADFDYNARWNHNMFSTGLEIGKKFTSQSGKISFNPYNRVLYNSAAAKNFGVAFGDDSTARVALNGYGAWTNRLGGRLTFNQFARQSFDPCAPCGDFDMCVSSNGRIKSMVFVGADWYKGLGGRFGGTAVDNLTGLGMNLNMGRTGNYLSYGSASAGVTFLPTDRLSITVAGEGLFGDVKGYGATLSTKVSF